MCLCPPLSLLHWFQHPATWTCISSPVCLAFIIHISLFYFVFPDNLLHYTFLLMKKWSYGEASVVRRCSIVAGFWLTHSVLTSEKCAPTCQLSKQTAGLKFKTSNFTRLWLQRVRYMTECICDVRGVKPFILVYSDGSGFWSPKPLGIKTSQVLTEDTWRCFLHLNFVNPSISGCFNICIWPSHR